MTIQETVDIIIDEAIDRAREHSDEAINKVDEAMQAASSLAIPTDPGNLDPAVGITPSAPMDDYAAVFIDNQNLMKDEIMAQSQTDFNQFLLDYFPLTLNAAQVAWLENSILNGGTGIDPNIEDAIYNRARDRLDEMALGATNDVTEQFAQLGWHQPPGALAARIRIIKQEARLKAREVNRDVAISAAEMEQKNVQFAVGEATKLQVAVWQAADGFSQSITRAFDPAVKSGAGIADATARFYDQTLQYYRTFLFAEQFEHDHRARDIEIDLKVANLGREIIDNRAGRMTEAALGAARTLGDMSAASLSGQNTMASAVVEELA